MNSDTIRFERLLERFDHYDPEFVEHFFEVADKLRDRCPVAHSDAHYGFWTLTRFDDVKAGFGDNERLSTEPTVIIPVNPGAVPLIPCRPRLTSTATSVESSTRTSEPASWPSTRTRCARSVSGSSTRSSRRVGANSSATSLADCPGP